jgi:mRNA interferase HigB
MRVVGREVLEKFASKHPDIKPHADAWLAEVEKANWKTPLDLKARFPKASTIGGGRAIFDLKGNNFRMDTKINFQTGLVLVVRVGTHKEYDRWTF